MKKFSFFALPLIVLLAIVAILFLSGCTTSAPVCGDGVCTQIEEDPNSQYFCTSDCGKEINAQSKVVPNCPPCEKWDYSQKQCVYQCATGESCCSGSCQTVGADPSGCNGSKYNEYALQNCTWTLVSEYCDSTNCGAEVLYDPPSGCYGNFLLTYQPYDYTNCVNIADSSCDSGCASQNRPDSRCAGDDVIDSFLNDNCLWEDFVVHTCDPCYSDGCNASTGACANKEIMKRVASDGTRYPLPPQAGDPPATHLISCRSGQIGSTGTTTCQCIDVETGAVTSESFDGVCLNDALDQFSCP